MRKSVWLICCLALICLTGCSDAACRATVYRDGSADLFLSLPLSSEVSALLSQFGLSLQPLQQSGWQLEQVKEGEATRLIAGRQFAEVRELLQLSPTLATLREGAESLIVTHGWLFDHYQLRYSVDLAATLQQFVPQWLPTLLNPLLDSSQVTLQVRLPAKPKEHNADLVSEHGHMLSWQVSYDQPRRLEIRLAIPNRRFWLMVAAGALLLVWLGVLLRRHRTGTRRRR